MKKEFYIIRHGQTDLNKEGIVQGRGVDSDLNETGLLQSDRFYQIYKNISFDKIYTSSLKRTWQTVAPFIEKGIPWEKLSGLDEMDWGIYEGISPSEETKEAFKKLLLSWVNGIYTTQFPGGESPAQVQDRQKQALDYIMANTQEKTILICMHGRAIRLFLCLLTGTEIKYMDTFPHQNLSLYRLYWENNTFELIESNNIAHVE